MQSYHVVAACAEYTRNAMTSKASEKLAVLAPAEKLRFRSLNTALEF